MDIDFVSLSISIMLILAFMAPIYVHVRNSNLKVANALMELDLFAQRHELQLGKKTHWRKRYFIGLDNYHCKLLFTTDMSQSSPIILDLNQVDRIVLDERFHFVSTTSEKTRILDSVYLQLVGKDGQVLLPLEFYDGNKFSDLMGEAVLAREWKKALEEVLTFPKNTLQFKGDQTQPPNPMLIISDSCKKSL